tara:strand:- start:83 stop:403 length:321 start_codon:yes stop_codon:yes gene_type:complete
MNDRITLIIDKIEKLIILVLRFVADTLGLLVGPAILTGISILITGYFVDFSDLSGFSTAGLLLIGPIIFIIYWIDHSRNRQGWESFKRSMLGFYDNTSIAFRNLLK